MRARHVLAIGAVVLLSAAAPLSGCGESATLPDELPALDDAVDQLNAGAPYARADLRRVGGERYDRLYAITPYTPAQKVRRRLGFESPEIEARVSGGRDDASVLAFVRDGRLLHAVAYPAGRADFSDIVNNTGIRSAEAVFTVRRSTRRDPAVVTLKDP